MDVIEKQDNLSASILINWRIKKIYKEVGLYKVCSVSFFKKKQPYRDFKKYLVGLNELIINIINNYPDYNLRIYHDATVIEQIENIQLRYPNNPRLEYYQYDVPFFHDEDVLFHKGTIGTIFRFLPLYEIGIDECIVVDIDKCLKKKLILNYMKKYSIPYSYNSTYFYSYLKRIRCIPNSMLRYSVLSNCIIQLNLNNDIIPSFDLFSDFLESLFVKKEILWCNDCELKNIYEYGIDEIFINHVYLSQIYSRKKETNILINISKGCSPIVNLNSIDFILNKLTNFKEKLNFKILQKEKQKYKYYIENEIIKNKDPVENRILKNILYNLFLNKNGLNLLFLTIKKDNILLEKNIVI